MFPKNYYETFMRYEASNSVFVAMPFSNEFKINYDKIILPAINSVQLETKKLDPILINRSASGSPDIHEKIFEAILHSRLVIADLSVQSSFQGDDGQVKWQPNANVAYEVGLASAWRNPEDILLIYQDNANHRLSFDLQNLRHVPYSSTDPNSIYKIAQEIVQALNQSRFLADQMLRKVMESLSPSAFQFMNQEVHRVFPVISFNDAGMPIMDSRIHAITELLDLGALKNRNVVPLGIDKGVAVLYEWTKLGIVLMLRLNIASSERCAFIEQSTRSASVNELPPVELRCFPQELTGDLRKK